MKKLFILFTITLLLFSKSYPQDDSAKMNTYVSINGNCSIEYPADWHQIPYPEFDRYLDSKQAGRTIYNYDAVFASNEAKPFYLGSYFIMSTDRREELTKKQIDSVLKDLSINFGEGVKYFPISDFLADLKSDKPTYDKEAKTISIYNKIVQNGAEIKNSLVIMKFYKYGIATFYFYAIGDNFEKEKELFKNIVESINTDDIEAKLPKEKVKVAQIDTTKGLYPDGSKSDSSNTSTAIYVSLGVVLFIILLRKKRKKNS